MLVNNESGLATLFNSLSPVQYIGIDSHMVPTGAYHSDQGLFPYLQWATTIEGMCTCGQGLGVGGPDAGCWMAVLSIASLFDEQYAACALPMCAVTGVASAQSMPRSRADSSTSQLLATASQ